MENLTDEQIHLLYSLYSLVLNAQNTMYRYNEIFSEKAVKGDVQYAGLIMSNNFFLEAVKKVLDSDEAKNIEQDMVERMYKFMAMEDDEEREVN